MPACFVTVPSGRWRPEHRPEETPAHAHLRRGAPGRRPGAPQARPPLRPTPSGPPARTARTRWRSSRRPTSAGSRRWCPSATAAWPPVRSPSTGERPTSWRPTWPPRPPAASGPRSAVTPTWPTSASTARRTDASSSTSTTSTRPCPARGSGTSSAWPPASPCVPATRASGWPPRAGPPARPPRPTASPCTSSRRPARWTSGTPASKPTTSSPACPIRCASRENARSGPGPDATASRRPRS